MNPGARDFGPHELLLSSLVDAKSAPGSYELIFLVNHTEDLLDSALRAMGAPPLQHKPDPLERDDIFNRVAWSVPREVRVEVGQRCPSFQRIVDKISQHFIDR